MSYFKRHNTMWVEALSFLDEAERLHKQFFRPGTTAARGPSWEPPIDIFESDQRLFIQAALPGVSAERLDVLIQEGSLVIIGERPMPAPPGARVQRLEIPYGRFERRVSLPAGHYEIHKLSFTDGCLVLELCCLV